MKAIVYTHYGAPSEVLKLTEVERPSPGDDEVLINVHAASINAADWHIVRAEPFLARLSTGLRKPNHTIPGADVAGRVEAVGSRVTRFRPGDAVFGDLSGCGWGAFAEYVCARETAVVEKPANITFEQAAAVPLAAVTALQGLRDKGRLQSGQRVLINGASGGVGSFAVQLAKAFGADVTGVCSTQKVAMVRSLGADQVIDYTQTDVTHTGQQYDLILDAAAYRWFLEYRRALRPNGRYVLVGGSTLGLFQTMLMGPVVSMFGSNDYGTILARPNTKDLGVIAELLETGKVTPVIDRCYPLSETVEAFRQLEERQVQGKIVITVAQNDNT